MNCFANALPSMYAEHQLSKQAEAYVELCKLNKKDGFSSEVDEKDEGFDCSSPFPALLETRLYSAKKFKERYLGKRKYERVIDPLTDTEGEDIHTILKNVPQNLISKNDLYGITKYIDVPKLIVFSKKESKREFVSEISIKNVSGLYISYRILTSNIEKFICFPCDIGWIPPNGLTKIFIRTNTRSVINFDDIVSESFLIEATRIYRKEQLTPNCLSLLWKAYGTEMFPPELVEEHYIDDLLPSDSRDLENFSMVHQLLFSAFFKENKDIQELDENCSDCCFFENWPCSTRELLDSRSQVIKQKIIQIERMDKCLSVRRKHLSLLCLIYLGSALIFYLSNYFSSE